MGALGFKELPREFVSGHLGKALIQAEKGLGSVCLWPVWLVQVPREALQGVKLRSPGAAVPATQLDSVYFVR